MPSVLVTNYAYAQIPAFLHYIIADYLQPQTCFPPSCVSRTLTSTSSSSTQASSTNLPRSLYIYASSPSTFAIPLLTPSLFIHPSHLKINLKLTELPKKSRSHPFKNRKSKTYSMNFQIQPNAKNRNLFPLIYREQDYFKAPPKLIIRIHCRTTRNLAMLRRHSQQSSFITPISTHHLRLPHRSLSHI